MGRIVAANAPALDIIEDVGLTFDRATLRGGVWAAEASQFLAEVLQVIATGTRALAGAEQELVKADSGLALVTRELGLQIGGYYYEQWQSIGRPQRDARFKILYPTGPSYWTSGPVERWPARLRVFAGLLSQHVHPRLSEARCDEIAAEIEQAHGRLTDALAQVSGPAARVAHGVSMRAAMAKVAQSQLSRMKRTLIGLGFRETEIHEVIPDRPKTAAARAAAAPLPGSVPVDPPAASEPPASDAPPSATDAPPPDEPGSDADGDQAG